MTAIVVIKAMGTTLAYMKNDDRCLFSTPPLEVTFSYVNGNFPPLNTEVMRQINRKCKAHH